MKTVISLPDDLSSAADALADRLGVSRSELYAAAVAEFLTKHDQGVTARLDQVYADDRGSLDHSLQRVQFRSVGAYDR